MPPHRQRLIFEGSKLKDSLKICDTNIKNQSTVQMVARRKGRNEESVFVQNCIQFADYCRLYSPTGVTFPGGWLLKIDAKNTTIGEFKSLIVNDSCVPRDEVILMFEEEVISNDDQLVVDALKGKNPPQFSLYSTKSDVVAMPQYVYNIETTKNKKKESNNLLRKVLTKSAGQTDAK